MNLQFSEESRAVVEATMQTEIQIRPEIERRPLATAKPSSGIRSNPITAPTRYVVKLQKGHLEVLWSEPLLTVQQAQTFITGHAARLKVDRAVVVEIDAEGKEGFTHSIQMFVG
jgi:hypothetical protein